MTSFARLFWPSTLIDLSQMSHGRCTLHNSRNVSDSCGVVHGDSCRVVHDGSDVQGHANSGGVSAHWNSCTRVHGHLGALQTKPLKRSSLVGVGCPTADAVQGEGALAQYLRWAPEGDEVQAWEGRIFLGFPQSGIFPSLMGVTSQWLPFVDPGKEARPPGPDVRSWDLLGWSMFRHTSNPGIWLFWGALRGEQVFPALVSCVDWVARGTYRTAWAVARRCRCPYSYGHGRERSWEMLQGLWSAAAI